MRILTLALALSALAPNPFAQADERPLRIDDVILTATERVTERAPMGGVISLRGPDFLPRDLEQSPDDFSHLAVTVGGAKAIVIDAQASAVTVLIPQFGLRPGRRTVRLVIAGRGKAEVDLQILPLEGFELPSADEAPALEPQRAAERARILEGFGVERFEFVRQGDGGHFEAVGGGGALPAGLSLTVSLSVTRDGERATLEQKVVRLEQPPAPEPKAEPASERSGPARWRVAFDPYVGPTPPGTYVLDLVFEVHRQTGEVAKGFRKSLTPIEREAWDHVLRRDYLELAPLDPRRR